MLEFTSCSECLKAFEEKQKT
eukprot:symbB.v1.2.040695.t1/scaffold7448.1/size11193/1